MIFLSYLLLLAVSAGTAVAGTGEGPLPWEVTYFQILRPIGGRLGPWDYKLNTTIVYVNNKYGDRTANGAFARLAPLTVHCNASWPLGTSPNGTTFDCDRSNEEKEGKWTFGIMAGVGYDLTYTEVTSDETYRGFGHFERGVNLRPSYAASGNYWEYLNENTTVIIKPIKVEPEDSK